MSGKNTAAWSDLISILEKQADAYERFLALLDRKENALISGDPKEMQNVINEERSFVSSLEVLEDERIRAATAVGGNDRSTLREMLGIVPPEMGAALENTAVRLIDSLNKVAIKNKSNAELIGTAMDFFNYMLNLMSSAAAPDDSTYGARGHVRQMDPKIKSILNRQV